MTDGGEVRVPIGEIVHDSRNPSVWEGAQLLASPAEVSRRLRAGSGKSQDLMKALARVESREADEDDIEPVLALSRWMMTRRVVGPNVRAPLHHVLKVAFRELDGSSAELQDIGFARLGERLSELVVADGASSSRAALGELLPREFLLRTEQHEQTRTLVMSPERRQIISNPILDIELSANPSGLEPPVALLKGCSACVQDPNSSRGGSKYCVGPDGEGRLIECVWPPPPPPEPPEVEWEYWVHVSNKWWTTLVGAWHGYAHTRTTRNVAGGSTSIPWTVPFIEAHVDVAKTLPGEDDYCGNVSCPGGDGCGDTDSESPGSDVDVSDTQFAFVGPWGVYSSHSYWYGHVYYCNGDWHWN